MHKLKILSANVTATMTSLAGQYPQLCQVKLIQCSSLPRQPTDKLLCPTPTVYGLLGHYMVLTNHVMFMPCTSNI